MSVIALIVFIIVQILFIPLAIIGASLVAYKQLIVSKRLGVSQTAIEIINNRWMMHIFGLRDDSPTDQLIKVLPNTSVIGLWLALFPLYLRYKISGTHALFPTIAEPGEESIANIVFNRSIYFDNIINQSKDQVEQFVVMGAGFDTRCYGDLKQSNLTLFELDQAKTQQLKREYIQKAGIDVSHVKFVEVNFSSDDWHEELVNTGYDPSKKSIFLWEGVTLYLTEKAVRKTLQIVKSYAATGSVIVADMYALSFVKGEYMRGMKATLPVLDMTDEGLGFGLDFSSDYENTLQSFIESEDMTVGDTYFMGHKSKKGTWMVVAEINI